VTALLRSRPGLLGGRPAAVRLVMIMLAVAGAALLLLAVARGTVWAPSAVTTVHVAGRPGAPVVDTTPEVLALDGPSVRVDVRAANPAQTVFVGVGRAADVEAYLGTASRTEITGVRGADAVVRQVGTDTSLPEPAGVDVWALAVTGQGHASLDWPQAAGRWRLVAAVDGATPPAQVVLTWQRDRAASPVPVLSAVGGLLLVLGLVGLRAARGRTTPASRPPAPPEGALRADAGSPAAEPAGGRRGGEHDEGGAPATAATTAVPTGYGGQVDHVDPHLDDEVDAEPEEVQAPAPFRQEQRP
jgi:hypothetical protein